MKRKTLKKALSAFLSLLMCMMTLLSISTPVVAATTVDAYMVDSHATVTATTLRRRGATLPRL